LFPLPDASRLYGSKITERKGKGKEKKGKKNIEYRTRNVEIRTREISHTLKGFEMGFLIRIRFDKQRRIC